MTVSKPKSKVKSYTAKVKVVDSSYQPSKVELEEDMRVNATFNEAVTALTRSVKIEYMDRPRGRGK